MQNRVQVSNQKTKLRKGDEVIVLSGSSRNRKGTIDKFDRKADRVFVAGVNVRKKNQKANAQHPDGGIVDKPMSIHISNVCLVDPKTQKATRLGYQMTAEGDKVRVTKASKTVL